MQLCDRVIANMEHIMSIAEKRVQFAAWQEANPEWQELFQERLTEQDVAIPAIIKTSLGNYARLNCVAEYEGNHHIYSFTANLDTGDFFMDCRLRKIYAKCALLTVFRPIHTIIGKTVYHILGIGIAQEVLKWRRKKQTGTDCLWHVGRELVDILRTPLYGVALTVMHVAGVIFGLIYPPSLYRIREVAGRIELSLNWGNRFSEWVLAFCFTPLGNLATVHNRIGTGTPNAAKHTYSALIRSIQGEVATRQEDRLLFNDCGRLLPKEERYISAAIKETVLAQKQSA